jgi:tetratricopeptide (TPR) repeat protein
MTESNNTHEQFEINDFSVGSTVFERFMILGEIASGAKGRVYKAKDLRLDTTVALKVLLTDHKNERDLVRFQSEARMASKMKHPGIATINDFGIFGNTPFLSMEYVDGESLEATLARNRIIPLSEFFGIFIQVCDAIQHAHSAGIVHRDIKPANIVMTRNVDGSLTVKVLDFGVAKNLDIVEERGGKLTPTGNIVGSPYYMSPEQSRGSRDLTAKSDNYSLGCVMWKCLVGDPPFESDSVFEMLSMHAQEKPEKLSSIIDVNEKLAAMIDALLSKNPDERPDLKDTVKPLLEELKEEQFQSELENRKRTGANEPTGTASSAKKDSSLFSKPGGKWVYPVAALFLLLVGAVAVAIFNISDLKERALHDKHAVVGKLSPVSDVAMLNKKVGGDSGLRETDTEVDRKFDEDIEKVKNFELDKIWLMQFLYTESNLRKCENLPGLQYLDLALSGFTDKQIESVLRMPNLLGLNLEGSKVITLNRLGELKKLKNLSLKDTQISDSALLNVAKVRTLEDLSLAGAKKLTDEGLKFLIPLKHLKTLDLSQTRITSKSLKYIKKIPELKALILSGTAVDENGLREFLKIPEFHKVKIDDCPNIDTKLSRTLAREFLTVSFGDNPPAIKYLNDSVLRALSVNDYAGAYPKIKEMAERTEKCLGLTGSAAGHYITLSMVAAQLGKYEEAERARAKVLKYAQQSHEPSFQMAAIDSLAFASEKRHDLKSLISAREKAIQLQEQLSGRGSNDVINRIMMMGETFKVEAQYAKAISVYELVLRKVSKKTDVFSVDQRRSCLLQMAECYRISGKTDVAIRMFNTLTSELESDSHLSNASSIILFHCYTSYMMRLKNNNKPREALEYSDKMIELAKLTNVPLTHQSTGYLERAELFDMLGRTAESREARAEHERIEQQRLLHPDS